MPNHCENDLYVQGEKSDVDALLLHIGMYKPQPEFDFNTLIPYPDPFKAMDDDRESLPSLVGIYRDNPEYPAMVAAREAAIAAYEEKWGTRENGYNSGGYEWCIKYWGTKWNAYDVKRRDYDGRVCITFQTAWAPPIPVIIELAKRFPTCTITLEYFERGMEFAGGFTCESEEDHWEDEPWQAGKMTSVWELKGYRGKRGG
jgi:hypothetical protein